MACWVAPFKFRLAQRVKDNHQFLTSAPVGRVIGTLALPTIVSMLVTSLYNLADTLFVGRLGTQATAAVGVVFTVMTLFQALGFFFGHGSGNYIAIQLGAGNRQEARHMVATGFCYGLIGALLLALATLLFASPICRWIGATPTILPQAEEYLRSVLWGGPFMVGTLLLNVQIRQQGNALLGMIGTVSGALLNLLLNPLFIFGLEMGIRGAGWATTLSQAASFFVLLYMTRRGGNIPVDLREVSLSPRYIRAILAGGTPSLTRQGLGSTATLLLNLAAAGFGDAAIAAMTIVSRLNFMIHSAVIGLGQGYQPLCGFCYGAGLYDRVKEGFRFCTRVGTLFLLLVSLFGAGLREEIIALFRDDPEVIRIGSEALGWQLITYPLGAFMLLSNMMMQALNFSLRANLLAAARRGLFFIPLLLWLPSRLGLLGLEISQPLADLFTFALSLPLLIYTFRQLKSRG